MWFRLDETRRQQLKAKLPAAYRRWPILGGVAAGLWFMVITYLIRLVLNLVRGDSLIAAFSLLWSVVCFVLWSLLHNWARKQPSN